jgi:hypothetical protein
MSDRDDSGQFTAAEPELYGQAAAEADLGYSPMPGQRKPDLEEDGVSEKLAGDIIGGINIYSTEIVPVLYQTPHGEQVDPNETVTPERAAADLTAYRQGEVDNRANSVSKDFAAEIDGIRSDAAKNDGEDLPSRGVKEPADLVKETINKSLETDKAEASVDDAPVNPAYAHHDPEVARALSNPVIHNAIQQEYARAEQTNQQFHSTLTAAQNLATASLAELAPGLAQIPTAQWQSAINQLAQTDPARAQAIVSTLDRAQRLDAVQQQVSAQREAQQTAQRQAAVQAFQIEQNRAFDKIEPMTESQQREALNGIVAYAQEYGVSKADLAAAIERNPDMRHAVWQKMMLDASRYRAMKANASRTAPRSAVPPVQRPGTAASRSERSSSGLDGLIEKFNSNPNLKTAAALRAAQVKARG